jgi:hypothetical protein
MGSKTMAWQALQRALTSIDVTIPTFISGPWRPLFAVAPR